MALQDAGYFVFLAIIALLHARLSPHKRLLLLLAASLVFYGMSSLSYLAMFLVLVTFNFWVAARLRDLDDGVGRALVFYGALTANLAVLVFFKYGLRWLNAGQIPPALEVPRSALMSLAIPLGISYFTFQVLSCVIDAHRRDWKLEQGWTQFAAFGLFFPQITSGPIPRAPHLLPQIAAQPGAGAEDVSIGLRMIGYGLFKKYVVANRINPYVTEIFSNPIDAATPHYTSIPTLIGCLLNVLNLYADFSSYVDIAIGSARLVGIRLDPNFDRPFSSTSVTELWRRWHMTLSFWLRDYLFMPTVIRLGNLGTAGVVIALLFTFAICGIWHDATWPYLLFGLAQGVAMSVELLTKRWRKRHLKRVPGLLLVLLGWTYTMAFFVLSEVFFRSPAMKDAARVFSRLFDVRLFRSAGELFAFKGPFEFALNFAVIFLWFAMAGLFRRMKIISTPGYLFLAGTLVLFLGCLGNGHFIYAGF
jgi:D-alanyl-lipoteichoic acid acyltransferase DltB (MBOAT superfamily)